MHQQDEIIERIAGFVHRRGLNLPAVLFLELHKPLAGVGSAMVQFLAPGLDWLLGEPDTEALANLLQDRQAVERLITRIGELDNHSGKEVKTEC